jgi:hypothetical protein
MNFYHISYKLAASKFIDQGICISSQFCPNVCPKCTVIYKYKTGYELKMWALQLKSYAEMSRSIAIINHHTVRHSILLILDDSILIGTY